MSNQSCIEAGQQLRLFMGKSQDAKKQTRKAPKQTAKEKKAAKKLKP